MMIARFAFLATIAAAPLAARAAPTVSVLVDRLCLASDGAVPLDGGGLLEQTATYTGPLLATSKLALVDIHANEGSSGGGEVRSLARSRANLSAAGFELFMVAELSFLGLPGDPTLPIWDSSEVTSQSAQGRLHWRFRADEGTSVRMEFVNDGLNGFVDVELINQSTGTTLVDYETTGNVQDSLENIPIAAGDYHQLSIKLGEFHVQDDDEAVVGFYFEEPVTLMSAARSNRAGCRRFKEGR